MKLNNRTILDLSKVQHGTFFYRNQDGLERFPLPEQPSVRGSFVSDKEIASYHIDYPGETMLERAKRLDIIDRWRPIVVFQLTANHNIEYTGKKAASMWEAWQKKILNKKKK